MTFALLIARLGLAAVFGVAGIAKLADRAGSRKSMADFGVPPSLAGAVGLLVPLCELVCAVALVPARWAYWGACGALALLLLFIAGISVNLAQGRKPDCHCFGQLHSSEIGWPTVLRNAVFSAIAAAIIWRGPGEGLFYAANNLSRTEGLAMALALAFVALAALQLWAFLSLLRQNGRLLLRIEALESRTPAPAEPPPAGLPVNSPAPPVSLRNLAGEPVTLDLREKPVLLLFSEPGCDACEAAMPDIAQWQRQFRDRLLIVPISRGETGENRAKAEKYRLENLLLQTDRETASAYLADSVPCAVLVRDGQIASPLSIGAAAIRTLVARAVLPAGVKKGDAVPSLKFPGLDGKTIDLVNLRGRRTLILFWNPSCGYCQQMLPDLKAWERNPPREAPDLLVIAAGSLEDNRQQDLRSPVLLDPYFAASQVFDAGGTPSAVLVDEQGRVASDVAVGAADVFALAAVPVSVAG